jgi:hypothetical protein
MANASHDDEIRELYANYFQVGYNAAEFLLDFGRCFENCEEQFYQRIITNPSSAKTLSRLLRESIDGYETTFGVIREDVGR